MINYHKLMTVQELSGHYRVTVSDIEDWIDHDKFPIPIMLASGDLAWPLGEVMAWRMYKDERGFLQDTDYQKLWPQIVDSWITDPCPDCYGSGRMYLTEQKATTNCYTCQGKGRVKK